MGEVIDLNKFDVKITDDLVCRGFPFKDFHCHQLITTEKLSKRLPPFLIETSCVYTDEKWFHPLVLDDLLDVTWKKFYSIVPTYRRVFGDYQTFENVVKLLFTRKFDWPKYQEICIREENWKVIEIEKDEEGSTIFATLHGLPYQVTPYRIYRYDNKYDRKSIGDKIDATDMMYFVKTVYLDKETRGGII